MKQATLFFLILLLVVGDAVAQTVETHEFGETNVQWYIYSSGKTWEFEADNTMTVETVEVKSVLASNGYRLYIEVSIEDDVIAEWDQYINDVHYQAYYHSKQVSYSLSAGDKIVYKIYGYGSPAGGILGINYIRLTGVTGGGGEANIAVSPDTLFFQVGGSNSSSSVLGTPPFYQNKTLSIQKSIRVQDLENKVGKSMSPYLTSDFDTLGNAFEGPLYMFNEDWQMYYEATKLVPKNTCVLKELRFAFGNYAAGERSKNCDFFVWDDNGGRPGALLWSTQGSITLAADEAGWFAIDVSQEDLTVDAFWMGHYEKSRGAPSSLSDSVATPGSNFYSDDGSNWEEDMYDYLHQAVVSYGSDEVEDVAQLVITNTGNAVLQISGLSCSQHWVQPVSPDNFTIQPGEQRNIAIWCTAEGLNDGQYTGVLRIASNDPDTPVYDVPLVFDVLVVDVAEEPDPELPTEFALQQNFPNPFNPQTEIGFTLPRTTYVVLRIYNVLGEEIRTLVNGSYAVGQHNVIWDGKDNNGHPVSSGVYLYQLQAGKFIGSRKMSLLR